ncbi:TetR/AcrR family transcriptional regulator [Zhongshania sp. BJYM1]|uniref:TetR/AcrR family transcriptional regulator n=1 Tax=Zhongshania aquatica TaxID=2965069 RepID=UPI0022B397F2|nr:TetR/AcrR family transcriptional regulator [Marortus sp. BJYM1]
MKARQVGRPRKITREKIISSALSVLENDGYTSLNIRAIAKEMGVNHATLYNYIDDIGQLEQEALQHLVAKIPIPNRSCATPLRIQLIEHFLCIREIQLRYPKFCHSPSGSKKWQMQMHLLLQVLDSICTNDSQVQLAVVGYNAILGVVCLQAERTRSTGNDAPIMSDIEAIAALPREQFATFFRQIESKMGLGKEVVSFSHRLNHLIDRLMPEMAAIDESALDELESKYLSNQANGFPSYAAQKNGSKQD